MSEQQEIFDRVVTHLFTQGRRAYDEEEDRCLYRTDDGLKCAVGCEIPDEMYSPYMEGKGVIRLLETKTLSQNLRDQLSEHEELYVRLQELHDDGRHWDSTTAMQTAITRWFDDFPDLDLTYVRTLKFADR